MECLLRLISLICTVFLLSTTDPVVFCINIQSTGHRGENQIKIGLHFFCFYKLVDKNWIKDCESFIVAAVIVRGIFGANV